MALGKILTIVNITYVAESIISVLNFSALLVVLPSYMPSGILHHGSPFTQSSHLLTSFFMHLYSLDIQKRKISTTSTLPSFFIYKRSKSLFQLFRQPYSYRSISIHHDITAPDIITSSQTATQPSCKSSHIFLSPLIQYFSSQTRPQACRKLSLIRSPISYSPVLSPIYSSLISQTPDSSPSISKRFQRAYPVLNQKQGCSTVSPCIVQFYYISNQCFLNHTGSP